MLVMGISGSFDRVDEVGNSRSPVHDSSAALIKDGEIVAAVEEERFNRCKHSGKMPVEAMQYCLFAAGTNLAQVDKFVFNVYEADMDRSLERAYCEGSISGFWLGRQFIQRLLEREFRYRVNPDRFEFIDHHYAHAASAFFPSSFPESLVVTFDGMGAGLSGSVWKGEEHRLIHLRNYEGRVDRITQSLGFFYLAITTYLGFRFFDEYKVMGLAPYGDRNKLRSVFKRFYSLKEKGDYDIFLSQLDALQDICPKRRADEPIETVHMDLAAATQESLETIAFHVLEFYKRETGASRLCLAGGVAQNCALNGKILREKLFDEVFVQPASHDGGLSLGGALHGYCASAAKESRKTCIIKHAYTGPSCGENLEIERELSRWSAWIEYERDSRISESVGRLLAEGYIVGWMQGRSEFGPRALGNRSIVADPRPAGNKDLINAMIKKREAFRPFAPSVLEEVAEQYFELPPLQKRFPYMVFVVNVKEEYRELLGAITHIDGTARIQTVSRRDNERFWKLIMAFGERTGVPIVLNTSFNNYAEPIVNTPRDAVACYLTTGLHILAIEDYIIKKKPVDKSRYADLRPILRRDMVVHKRELKGPIEQRPPEPRDGPFFNQLFLSLIQHDPDKDYYLGNTHDGRKTEISPEMAIILTGADGYRTLGSFIKHMNSSEQERLLDETLNLWGRRVIRLEPES